MVVDCVSEVLNNALDIAVLGLSTLAHLVRVESESVPGSNEWPATSSNLATIASACSNLRTKGGLFARRSSRFF